MISSENFTCATFHSVFVCKASDPAALLLVKQLQFFLQKAASQLTQVDITLPATCAKVPPDGVIGPLTAIAAQHVTAALNRWVPAPKNLQRFLHPDIGEKDLIKLTAEAADELIGYMEYVLSTNPSALVSGPPSPQSIKGAVTDQIKSKLKTVAMIGVGVGAAGGLAYLGKHTKLRQRGLKDMADVLPEISLDSDDDSEEEEVPAKGSKASKASKASSDNAA